MTIRPPRPGDGRRLVAGRDEEFRRFLGPGSPDPQPTACIEVGGEVVGWVDADADSPGLAAGEVNIGYHVFAAHRGHGYATRAVRLLLEDLRCAGQAEAAVALIDPTNHRSLAVVSRAGFASDGERCGQLRFRLGLR